MAAKKCKNNPGGKYYVFLSLLIILVILVLLYYVYEQINEKPLHEQLVTRQEEAVDQADAYVQLEKLRSRPDFAWPVNRSAAEKLQLVEHNFLSLGYSEKHEQASWVSYLLSRRHELNARKRRNNFRSDPQVLSGSAQPKDYSRSGYDRGHLAPAADFDYNGKALSETFYMSNISPQKPAFNRGAWKELEEMSREWASLEDSLWVVTGPVLGENLKKIGSNKVSVPKYFYKIILDARPPSVKLIGFLMPNRKIKEEPWRFAVAVDSIEQLSGLDFFPQIPDLLEESLEKNKEIKEWLSPEGK